MRRTSIELDEDLLAQAQQALGTTGIKATVEGAFREVVRRDLLRQLAEQVKTGDGIDRGEELLEASRRWTL